MATSVVEMDSTQAKHRPHGDRQVTQNVTLAVIDVKPLARRVLRRILLCFVRPFASCIWSHTAFLCS